MAIDDGEEKEDFILNIKKKDSLKEEVLDENFKKAEIKQRIKKSSKIPSTKRPFLKLGIVLIFLSFICLALINILPWMYIKVEVNNEGTEQFFYKEFLNKNQSYFEINQTDNKTDFKPVIDNIFDSKCHNCSENSKYFIGLSKADFSVNPVYITYGFIFLIIIGLIFTIYETIEKILKFPHKSVSVIHSLFATITIFICTYILFYLIPFLGAHILQIINAPFLRTFDINYLLILFILPLILIAMTFLIIRIGFAILKMNFNDLNQEVESELVKEKFSPLRYKGGPL